MLELRIITGKTAVPLFDLPALMGRSGARQEIGDQIESLIAFMDDLDGDSDFEDALDTEDDEPTFYARVAGNDGPGCSIADVGGCEHDGREPSWTEASSLRGNVVAGSICDDDEDNGDREGVDDDTEPNGDEQDTGNGEDEILAGLFGYRDGPGCPVSDPGGGTEGEY